jgi:UDP-2,3-diacylglucosamine pyrophosphatase LpxH
MKLPYWCCSDLHSDYSRNAGAKVLCRARTEASLLILDGDCFGDTLTKTWASVWGNGYVRDFVTELWLTAERIPVHYIAGNHDELTGPEGAKIREVLAHPNITFHPDYLDGATIGLSGWRYCHGHVPAMGDFTTSIWSTLIGLGNHISEEATEKVAQWILDCVFGRKPSPGDMIRALTVECDDMPVAVLQRAAEVAKAQHWLHEAHCKWLAKHPEVKNLVCGHSHRAEVIRLRTGQTYINDGAIDGYTATFLSIDPETQTARIEDAR